MGNKYRISNGRAVKARMELDAASSSYKNAASNWEKMEQYTESEDNKKERTKIQEAEKKLKLANLKMQKAQTDLKKVQRQLAKDKDSWQNMQVKVAETNREKTQV